VKNNGGKSGTELEQNVDAENMIVTFIVFGWISFVILGLACLACIAFGIGMAIKK
jgi:hypothetical protein